MSNPPWNTPDSAVAAAHRRLTAKRRRRAELAEARAHGVRARNSAKLARLANRANAEPSPRYRPALRSHMPGP